MYYFLSLTFFLSFVMLKARPISPPQLPAQPNMTVPPYLSFNKSAIICLTQRDTLSPEFCDDDSGHCIASSNGSQLQKPAYSLILLCVILSMLMNRICYEVLIAFHLFSTLAGLESICVTLDLKTCYTYRMKCHKESFFFALRVFCFIDYF